MAPALPVHTRALIGNDSYEEKEQGSGNTGARGPLEPGEEEQGLTQGPSQTPEAPEVILEEAKNSTLQGEGKRVSNITFSSGVRK